MDYIPHDSLHDRLKGVHELMESLQSPNEKNEQLQEKIAKLGDRSTQELIARIGSTTHPFALWLIHRELDRRDVPPCLRTPYRDESTEQIFITWLADVYWLAKRHPKHPVAYSRFRHLFISEPDSEQWHKTAIWVYRHGRGKSGHYFSRALALTDQMRQPLAMLVSHRMQGDRTLLRSLPKHREALLAHAVGHRDKSQAIKPVEVAERRTELLRLHLLSGRNRSTAAAWHHLLHGGNITRQAVAKQITAIQRITGLRLDYTN